MLVSESIKRLSVGGDDVLYVMKSGKPIYIQGHTRRPYYPALKANGDGTGEVVLGGRAMYVEDLTGNGNAAVAPSTDTGPIVDVDGGLKFDGVDDYLIVQPSPSLDFGGKTQITLECWAKSNVAGWKHYWNMISRYSNFLLAPNSQEVAMIVTTSTTSWVPYNYGSIDWGQASDPTFDEMLWHHYCGVIDTVAGYCKMYVDGVLRATHPVPNSPLTSDDGPIHLGNREANSTGIYNLSANLSDVRIWDRARTQTEIQRDMNRRLLGFEDGLRAYWPF